MEWGPVGPLQPHKDCCWSSVRERTGLLGTEPTASVAEWFPSHLTRVGKVLGGMGWPGQGGLLGRREDASRRSLGDLRAQRSPLVPAVWPQRDRFFPRPEDPPQWVLMPVSRGCGEGWRGRAGTSQEAAVAAASPYSPPRGSAPPSDTCAPRRTCAHWAGGSFEIRALFIRKLIEFSASHILSMPVRGSVSTARADCPRPFHVGPRGGFRAEPSGPVAGLRRRARGASGLPHPSEPSSVTTLMVAAWVRS